MKEKLKFLGILILFGIIAVAAIKFDFYIWKLQHPFAPDWTFFFKN